MKKFIPRTKDREDLQSDLLPSHLIEQQQISLENNSSKCILENVNSPLIIRFLDMMDWKTILKYAFHYSQKYLGKQKEI